MTTTFNSLYEFTNAGMRAFQQAFEGQLDEAAIDVTDPALVTKINGTTQFRVQDWQTSKDMAQTIISACGSVPLNDLLRRTGLWAWLSFVMRDSVYPRRPDGLRKLGEIHRWLPADLDDYQKGQRHLIRMPV